MDLNDEVASLKLEMMAGEISNAEIPIITFISVNRDNDLFETLCKAHKSISIIAVSSKGIHLEESISINLLQSEKKLTTNGLYSRVYTTFLVHFDEIPFTDTTIFITEDTYQSKIETTLLRKYVIFQEMQQVCVQEMLF